MDSQPPWPGAILVIGVLVPARAQDTKVDPAGTYIWTVPADVSFCVVRSFNDNTVTNKYSGTLADAVIKGKMEFERNGEAQSRDWKAKLQQ